MFKSNFSRYVLTFGFLILISFSAVSAIMFYGVIGYARNSKKDTTYDLAKIIFEDIQTKMTVENKDVSFGNRRISRRCVAFRKVVKNA